jgi:hypothetical protein
MAEKGSLPISGQLSKLQASDNEINLFTMLIRMPSLSLNSPIASILCCQKCLFLVLGEVINIVFQVKPITHLPIEYLTDATTFVTYQVLFIIPATADNNDPKAME